MKYSYILACIGFLLIGAAPNAESSPVKPHECHWDGEMYHCGVGSGSGSDDDEEDEYIFDPIGNTPYDGDGIKDDDIVVYGPREATPAEKEAAKQSCISDANALGTQCLASYASLHVYCNGVSLLIGGAVLKVFYAGMGNIGWHDAGSGVATTTTIASACAYVNVKAQAWCKNQTESKVKSCG
ncbi:MAG: hypothetical protein HRT35_14865 [Algicola sp.]|nr:hypothetical protein [Algicola sp.]